MDCYCKPCRDYYHNDINALRQRRQLHSKNNSDGIFFIEKIIKYDPIQELYFVNWKGFPGTSNSRTVLQDSFLDLAQDFWDKQDAFKRNKKAISAIKLAKKAKRKG